ncbi:hypothetical protein OOK41_13980 [Micromonospora sp. NBC_01655]|uniref:hypothetical protein n=1 Tax=Micromonospora sp. NBC_01655 TaxID=2975983 RepID=UPI0022530448|nr:hypothetical protein [Micromonospora sp. NBC_01655]MCX4471403.1 hypothetical protein [Micromonospora sp. NBC_01655]
MTIKGAAGIHVVSGVALLRPEEQVFAAMLDGWQAQQTARNLSFATIAARLRVIRAFAEHVNNYPWQWLPQMVDEWSTDLRAVRGLARSTLRGYQEAVRLFCEYLTDPAYGWAGQCQQRSTVAGCPPPWPDGQDAAPFRRRAGHGLAVPHVADAEITELGGVRIGAGVDDVEHPGLVAA